MFKIAYCAGHYLGTAGKRVPKALDKNQTREWTLNDRVARYFAEAAALYEGVQLLRTDDPTGQKYRSIAERTKLANDWGAQLYLDIHHNAGISLGKGGGVVAISVAGMSFDWITVVKIGLAFVVVALNYVFCKLFVLLEYYGHIFFRKL